MKKSSLAALTTDTTPRGKLGEGAIHELLGYQLAQASIFTDKIYSQEVGIPFSLRRVEFTILQLIKENAAVTPTRLAQALAVTTPGITVWLDRLVGRGWVSRERSKSDGRAQQLSLTTAGKTLVNKALQLLLKADKETLQHLSDGEHKILIELLHKVARSKYSKDSVGQQKT